MSRQRESISDFLRFTDALVRLILLKALWADHVCAQSVPFGTYSAEDDPFKGYGNFFCFTDGSFSFETCCIPDAEGRAAAASAGCWSGPYSFETCCYSAHRSWWTDGGCARAQLGLLTGSKGRGTPGPSRPWASPCTSSAAVLTTMSPELHGELLEDGSGKHFIRNVRLAWPLDVQACRSAGGWPVTVKAWWADFEVHESRFELCVPGVCALEDVAADLAPLHFAHHFNSLGADAELQQMEVCAADTERRRGSESLGVTGSRVPPGDLPSHRRLFWLCGRCPLRRYGSAHDGGYLMCALEAQRGEAEDPFTSRAPIRAIYSYGVEGEDNWGEAVARATGAVVHQYDCFDLRRPAGQFAGGVIFHEECLGGASFEDTDGRRYATLAEHLHSNGHFDGEGVGSMLLKVDVEGSEWHALGDVLVLRKFQQVVVEFHTPYLNKLVPTALLSPRAATLQTLLYEAGFFVVHVHVNNRCKWPERGSCLEVTFASRAAGVQPLSECKKPSLHQMDAPNVPTLPEVDVSELF